MAVTPDSPGTCTGTRRWVVVPSPSWPSPLPPQAHTVPPWRRANEWLLPAATAVMFVSSSACVGLRRWVVVPSPSCPWLLLPQLHTVPVGVTYSECPNPPARRYGRPCTMTMGARCWTRVRSSPSPPPPHAATSEVTTSRSATHRPLDKVLHIMHPSRSCLGNEARLASSTAPHVSRRTL